MSTGEPVEVGCDESGYEGEKHIGAVTDVFAHASVRLDVESAARCIHQARDWIGSPAVEYKANHLLRRKSRPVLRWLLAPSGPLAGHARVYRVDKALLLLTRLVEVLLAGEERSPELATVLSRQGRRSFGGEPWDGFLATANDLLRSRDRLGIEAPVDAFFEALAGLCRTGTPGAARDALGLFGPTRPRAAAFRARLTEHPPVIPALDPLFPAIIRAVETWPAGDRPVRIVHDRQKTLTEARVDEIQRRLGGAGQIQLRLVDSQDDPRVQVADFLAGVARKISSDDLNGHGDPDLTTALRPFVDGCSVWGKSRY